MPKIIIPIVEESKEAILSQAQFLLGRPFDLVEWRVDFYRDALDIERVLDTLNGLREILGEIPILVTFRTKAEGGMKDISQEEYTALNLAIAKSGNADAVDVEILMGDELVNRMIREIHEAGVTVVGSSHEFGPLCITSFWQSPPLFPLWCPVLPLCRIKMAM